MQSVSRAFLSFLYLTLTGNLLFAQFARLDFRPVAAEYSTTLDRIVMISASPNLLHIYNPASRTDRTVALSRTPLSLSVDPQGVNAAVGHDNSITYINLQNAIVTRTFPLTEPAAQIALSSRYAYTFARINGSNISVNLATGATTTSFGGYVSSPRVHPAEKAIYATRDGLSPNDVQRFDIAGGVLGANSDSPYHGDYYFCGGIWYSPNGQRIHTGCATAVNYSETSGSDMTYAGSLEVSGQITGFTQSSVQNRIAVIPAEDSTVSLLNSSTGRSQGKLQLTRFQAGPSSFPAHAKWLFYDASGTSLHILTMADPSSGLLNDFAIQSISLATPNQCVATFSGVNVSVPSTGFIATSAITAGADCLYQATSGASWISILSGGFGSGDGTLRYHVAANPGPGPRSASINLGGQMLILNQDAPPATPAALTRLSYNVADAEYDKPLDRLVLISQAPDQLHLVHPVTLDEQVVPLAMPPLSVSVAPDGLRAAVGHNGQITLVNLQTLAVERTYTVPTDVTDIVLAGNGYLYAFPARDWSDIYSLQLSTGVVTPTSAIYNGRIARLHPGGNSLYLGGNWFSKWSIANGVAAILSSSFNFNTCGNIWLSEPGDRLFTACGSVYRASDVPSQDLTSNGSLAFASSISSIAHSAQQRSIAVLAAPSGSSGAEVQLYGDEFLGLLGRMVVPKIAAGGTDYTALGRFLFWDQTSTRLLAILSTDPSSGILNSYAIASLTTASITGCTVSAQVSQSSFPGTGGTATVTVTAPAGCTWSATASPASWISGATGEVRSGNGSFTIQVLASSTLSPRTATLTVNNQSISISQAAAVPTLSFGATSLTHLAFAQSSSLVGYHNLPNQTWSATSNASWITIISPMPRTGTDSFIYSITANPGVTRVGTITAGGTTITIAQTGAIPTPALRFVPLQPCRIADTRLPNGTFGGPVLAGGSSRSFSIPASPCGIPATVAAYSLNVTVVPRGPLSYLTLWPTGQDQPFVSTLNSFDGRVKANAAIVPAGTDGAVSVFVTDTADVVLDINGYFVAASTPNALAFYPLAPCRLFDTRLNPGGPALAAAQPRSFAVRNSACNVPATATAYSLNVTAIPSGPLGYLSIWPDGTPQPFVSTLNAPTGTVTANAAIVPAGANGSISLFASNATHVAVDINGYFAPPGAVGGLSFYPLPPCRTLDTRFNSNLGELRADGSQFFGLGQCGVPSIAQARSFNATVIPRGSLSYLTLFAFTSQRPLVSTLNAFDGSVVSNAAILPALNAIEIYATDPTHLILDLNGYFAP